MTVVELIEELFKFEDLNEEICISVDISTGREDAHARVFTDEYLGIKDTRAEAGEAVLLFSGEHNGDS